MTAPTTRVVFVDDDPLVLRALQRMFRNDASFDCAFAPDGHDALVAMRENTPDIVVSDFQMPGMDGRALLTEVQTRHPDTVRIILTGETDARRVFRAVPVAHQFLAKPTHPRDLVAVLDRARELRRLLNSEALRALVGSDGRLPSPPTAYVRLTQYLSDPEVPLGDVAELVEQDVALTAQITRFGASAFIAVPSSVRSVRGIITYLGADMIKTLVLANEVFHSYVADSSVLDIDEVQRHAILTARIAEALMEEPADRSDALLAGMLHDVGALLLAARAPELVREVRAHAANKGICIHEAEHELLGASHAEVGAYLMGIWGLPDNVIWAIAHHHELPHGGGPKLDVDTAVHIAASLAHGCEAPCLDVIRLAEREVLPRLPQYERIASRLRGDAELH